uniref:Uncharacterized protein LOC111124229 n=1 Tax=Crassostrea virginica TaxID=6565 RepID=A0A8B8D3T7_CRAVI|nr:uncharacterized protein LOC111124229 [Crassostrea virginica]
MKSRSQPEQYSGSVGAAMKQFPALGGVSERLVDHNGIGNSKLAYSIPVQVLPFKARIVHQIVAREFQSMLTNYMQHEKVQCIVQLAVHCMWLITPIKDPLSIKLGVAAAPGLIILRLESKWWILVAVNVKNSPKLSRGLIWVPLHCRAARPRLRRRKGANDVCSPFNWDSSQLSQDFLTPKVTRSLSPGQGLSWDPLIYIVY